MVAEEALAIVAAVEDEEALAIVEDEEAVVVPVVVLAA